MDSPDVLLLADARPPAEQLAHVARVLTAAGLRALLVLPHPLPEEYGDLGSVAVRAGEPAAAEHGPAFRRHLAAAERPERFGLLVDADPAVEDAARVAVSVIALTPGAEPSARRLVERHPGLSYVAEAEQAASLSPRPARQAASTRAGGRAGRGRLARAVAAAPGLSDERRYARARDTALALLRAGQAVEAELVVQSALSRLRDPRLRADLLGDLVSWSLAHGLQPSLARDAYAAELAVADDHLARGETREAAAAFVEATRTATHRVLHFDGLTSPLADDPRGFTTPLRDSEVAKAVRAPRGRQPGGVPTAPTSDGPTSAGSTSGRTRLLIATRVNADFLGEIRAFFERHPDFEVRFVDFAEAAPELDRFVRAPELIVRQTLGGGKKLSQVTEQAFREHLDWADVVFVEWCTALAALLTQVDPRDTRVVVRMHSYEAFTVWPQLVDFSRVDDMVFVSDHLRDLAVGAVPGLEGPDAPRLHVLPNAMDLRRFERPKREGARFTLGVVGASKMVKDPRWAVEVLRHLREHDDRYRLVLLRGKLQEPTPAAAEYAAALRRDIAELEPAVHVLKHTDDVPAALEDIGVVLSSSVRESFHMGLVEGVASGAVPVVRDWPFFPGATRGLFPPEWTATTPARAAERILEETASEDRWRQEGRAAGELVLRRWDWSVVSAEYADLLAVRRATDDTARRR